MRREDIANFFTAERRVSPLMAFSLLITAGFIAGSLQLVSPQQSSVLVMTAATAIADDDAPPTTTKYDSPAPENCTKAIEAALGKYEGPEVTSTDKGQSGTVDACFGAVLTVTALRVPSNNPKDYTCVGRSGKITITSASTIGKTKPDRSVPMGQCKVQVCQPYTVQVDGVTSTIPNCGDPKQFGAGQAVTAGSGGVPSIPQIPTDGSTAIPQTPTPNTMPPVQPLDFTTTNPPVNTDEAKRIADLANQNGADPFPFEEPKRGDALVPGGSRSDITDDCRLQGICAEDQGGRDGNADGAVKPDPYKYGSTFGSGSPGEVDFPVDKVAGTVGNSGSPGEVDFPVDQVPKSRWERFKDAIGYTGSGTEKIVTSVGDFFTGKPSGETTIATGSGSPGEVDFPVDTVPKEPPALFSKEAFDNSKPGQFYNWAKEGLGFGKTDEDETIVYPPPIIRTDTTTAPAAPASDSTGSGSPGEVDFPVDRVPAGPLVGDPSSDDYCWKNPGACAPGGRASGPVGDPSSDDYCSKNPGACVAADTKPATTNTKSSCERGGTCAGDMRNDPVGTYPKAGDVLQSDYYCLTKIDPIIVIRVPAGSIFPSGCLNNGTAPPAPVPGPGGGGGGGGGGNGGGGGGSGSGMSGLTSFLGGLMKGMGGMLGAQKPQQQAPACKTDPQQYAQQQQQYNQQLQQYNYQLQQHNYQQQQNMQYGYSSYGSMPPQPPQPCSQGGAGSGGQCQPLAAQPNPATCPIGSWRQMTTSLPTGQVCPVWQCVGASSTMPTAQLTCEPGVAEDGTRVTISYTCGNSKTSTGYGFVTGGATSGATSTIITPPANAAGINFALKCENGNLSAGAQCSVQIAKVSISMRVVPEKPRVGESALIGWVTTGMESCTVSSPDQPEFTDRNSSIKKTSGIATSSPLTERTDFYLNCTTVTGGSREEKITVDPYLAGTVTSSIETRTNVARGSTATIQWNFPNAPDVSAVALWLYNVEDKRTVALISGHRAKAGNYTWDIPTENDACNTSSSLVCGSDLIPGRTYTILASLYTPPNASLGEFNDPSLPEPEFLDNPSTNSFKFSQ